MPRERLVGDKVDRRGGHAEAAGGGGVRGNETSPPRPTKVHNEAGGYGHEQERLVEDLDQDIDFVI